jgi:hypothetical protein
MNLFRIHKPDNFSIIGSFHEREAFWMDPPYQRQGDIWPSEKRKLLIDSLLNGFDLPKIYLHEFYPFKTVKGRECKYGVVDGKQRLSTIWQFVNNNLPLSDDFVYLRDRSVKIAGLTHREIGEKYPVIRDTFNGTTLPVITIITEDTEIIEEMFSRLNEGVPLTAAEKRNTFGGPAPAAIRQIAKHNFFTQKLPFTNRRYRHFDLAAKFLFFATHGNEPRDSKKDYLDEFVKQCKQKPKTQVSKAAKEALEVLGTMSDVFVNADELLRSVGMTTIYYLLMAKNKKVKRKQLLDFEEKREKNREVAEEDITKGNYELLEFDRFSQSPNDSVAMKYRLKVLNSFLK